MPPGEYWQGPIALNRTATHVLGDLLDADARMPPSDAAAPHVLRREDIVRASTSCGAASSSHRSRRLGCCGARSPRSFDEDENDDDESPTDEA